MTISEASFCSFFAAVAIIFIVLAIITDRTKYDRGYKNGWDNCIKAHNNYEMTDDEKIVFDIIKKSIKQYLRNKRYFEKGDLEAINNAEDLSELKDIIWVICVLRKETKKERK